MKAIWRHLIVMVALSVAISVVFTMIAVDDLSAFPWRYIFWRFAIGSTFGMCIGAISWSVMSRFAHAIWQLHPLPRWATLLAIFCACGAAGSFLAVLIVTYVYRMAWETPVLLMWQHSLQSTMAVTIPVGTVITLIEAYRARLRDTEVQLRTKELERERAMKLATEAQLAALSARVEPHFLFNTLNTISSLIREDPERAERTIEQLSALLRSSLDSTNTATIPLEQEMRLVASYLDIQATRFGDRLRFTLAPPEGMAHVIVPPFSIQTLVENSVKYAVAPRREGGSIHVRLEQDDTRLLVDIEDDGPGFTPQQIPSGHGIDNLQGRLQTLFGAASSLEFIRAPGLMRVRMRVPA
jgi:two-component system sensor histidine kinase AlgZ